MDEIKNDDFMLNYIREYFAITNKLIVCECDKTKIFIALANAVSKLNAVQNEKEYSIKDFYKGE